jgi:hypothetical protein
VTAAICSSVRLCVIGSVMTEVLALPDPVAGAGLWPAISGQFGPLGEGFGRWSLLPISVSGKGRLVRLLRTLHRGARTAVPPRVCGAAHLSPGPDSRLLPDLESF